jgi:hypothetical protein
MADTEIDWKAYMEQVSQFVSGERDYTLIKGGTGPLVYPGAHVFTYTGLYYLTDEGKDIFLAQQLFAGLYMITLAVVMVCYWRAKVGLMNTSMNYCAFTDGTGSALCLSPFDRLKAPAQHLCAAMLQRLLCCLVPMDSHSMLPAPSLDTGQSGIFLGPGH